MHRASATPLLVILASAWAGHVLVVRPLLETARHRLAPAMCPAVECTAAGLPMTTRPTMTNRPGVAWGGPFHASSMGERTIWRGAFLGSVRPLGSGLEVELHSAEVALSPEAPAGVLRGLRLDLAEATPDGSWRIVRTGDALELGRPFEPGVRARLRAASLSLPDVSEEDLQGRWLVATMLVDTPGGFAPLAHAHMEWELAQRLAQRAARAARLRGPDPQRR